MSTDARNKRKRWLLLAVALVPIGIAAVWILLSRPGRETVDRVVPGIPGVAGEFKSLNVDAGMIKVAENDELIMWLDGATSSVVMETRVTATVGVNL